MAEIVNLKDRGQQIVQHVDVYSENTLGAGQLACDGRFNTVKEAKAKIDEILKNSPIQEEGKATSALSINRFSSNHPWGHLTPEFDDPYPRKSSHIVLFRLDFSFGNDFCNIDLGIKWAPYRLANGELNPDYPLGEYEIGHVFSTSDLKILRVTMCTVDDAEILVQDLGLTDPRNLEVLDFTQDLTDEQLEAIKLEEGDSIATTKINGEETILVANNRILTINDTELTD